MKPKAFVLQNKGMNRDLSVSKAGESSAYENHNVRILARDHDTMLSITNERGNKHIVIKGLDSSNLRITEDEELRMTEDELFRPVADESYEYFGDIPGILIGWNVLNNNIILFTVDGLIDRIYRIKYEEDGFHGRLLFEGELGFALNNPIESVVYYETEDIQKIYWVDGKNVLRFMNFAEEPDENGYYPWQDGNGNYDVTYFDSNREISFGVNVRVTKNNSGNPRPNGVIQYFLTYYNEHGQETGFSWMSDLVYLSPIGTGGAADANNNNAVTLEIEDLDTRFTNFRIYSVFRSSLNGTPVSYIVYDGSTSAGKATVVDTNAHLTSVDYTSLLYMGSKNAVAGTLTHKDQTLFLGDLSSIGRGNYDEFENFLKDIMLDKNVEEGKTPWKCKHIVFNYSDDMLEKEVDDIPYTANKNGYSYESQLVDSSSAITTFKGGEKYRFALSFQEKDGNFTDAFWIGDAVNDYYPVINEGDGVIKRIVARCTLPSALIEKMREMEFKTVRLMVAEATYADRSIKAQGIVNPTVFNVWNRFNGRLYASPSWMMRPRHAEFAWKHFSPIDCSIYSTGEIDCNYWEGGYPTPYYRLKNYATSPEYNEVFDGIPDYTHAMIIYRVRCDQEVNNKYGSGVTVILAKALSGNFSTTDAFSEQVVSEITNLSWKTQNDPGIDGTIVCFSSNVEYRVQNFKFTNKSKVFNTSPTSREKAYNYITECIRNNYSYLSRYIVSGEVFDTWCNRCSESENFNLDRFFVLNLSTSTYTTFEAALNTNGAPSSSRWYTLNEEALYSSDYNYVPSYYKKHLMFIDENTVTLNSPEIEYEAVSFDNVDKYKFRIVGIARIDSNYSDYVVEAIPGKLAGENLVREKLSNHLIAWPLWKEYGLLEREYEAEDPDEEHTVEDKKQDRDSYDYIWGGTIAKYWLRMWNHSDKINGFTDYNNDDYSRLIHKTFANAKYSSRTYYNSRSNNAYWECEPNSIRLFNFTSSQYMNINAGMTSRYYDGIINESLSCPGTLSYPVLYSVGSVDANSTLLETDNVYLYLSNPVSITYSSTPHAVITLPSGMNSSTGKYEETILPKMYDNETISMDSSSASITGDLLPWIDNTTGTSYGYIDYDVKQGAFSLNSHDGLTEAGKYVYIGEIYDDLPDDDEIRYGGTTDSAIQNCRFVPAGPIYSVDRLPQSNNGHIYANQGDTYFQRWDCLKTKKYSTDCVNNVIDITSVMLETHINIDGRTDLQRGTSYIASIDTEKFGSLNPVYSQRNNFIVQKDLDDDFNLDSYRSSITWTLEKHDSEDVDAWSHITLASTLKLDGDKGICQALRRWNNSIIAFQDKGLSEILFNSRTQLTTTDGVPVEIANSGKVDGKRYITNKYGCTNKWSIVEGKSGLYFIDNINKAFCAAQIGQGGRIGVGALSDRLGFGAWFREINDMNSWKPVEFNNVVSYYDKIHSDIYLVRNTDDDMSCLVYNEDLSAFTSFFDYRAVLMMTNVDDRFVSFKHHSLWLQNEGLYGSFFGEPVKDFWVHYRVTPEPYSDKIWTNVEYRADFYEVLDDNGDAVVPESSLINGDVYGELNDTYKESESFTDYKVWNEYQTTGIVPLNYKSSCVDPARKKFRIWRLTIPRSLKKETGMPTLDRIRNPWINIKFKKENQDGKHLVQMHDFIIKYFE